MTIQVTARMFGLSLIAVISLAGRLMADVEPRPPHAHPEPAPNKVVTNVHGTLPGDPAHRPHAPGDGHSLATHDHQHRTAHRVDQGVFVHSQGAGAQAYVADKVWVGRNQHSTLGGAVGGHAEFGHGHQGHELDAGRYAVAVDTWPVADRAAVILRVQDAFEAWVAVGNASGARNWPDGEDHERNAEGQLVARPGTGVAWHSSIDWVYFADPAQADVVVEFTNEGLADGTVAAYFRGTFVDAAGNDHTRHIHVRTDPGGSGWSYDLTTTADHHLDFMNTILHEVGHVVAFDHFGSYAAKQIMNAEGKPLRDGHIHVTVAENQYIPFDGTVTRADGTTCPVETCVPGGFADLGVGDTINYPAGSGVLRSIDPDAVHGLRDLYAIAVPEPSTITLMLIGLVASWRRFTRRGRGALVDRQAGISPAFAAVGRFGA